MVAWLNADFWPDWTESNTWDATKKKRTRKKKRKTTRIGDFGALLSQANFSKWFYEVRAQHSDWLMKHLSRIRLLYMCAREYAHVSVCIGACDWNTQKYVKIIAYTCGHIASYETRAIAHCRRCQTRVCLRVLSQFLSWSARNWWICFPAVAFHGVFAAKWNAGIWYDQNRETKKIQKQTRNVKSSCNQCTTAVKHKEFYLNCVFATIR